MIEGPAGNVTTRRKPPLARLKSRKWRNTIIRETKPVTIAMPAAQADFAEKT